MTFQIFNSSCMCPAAEPMSYHIDDTCAEYIDIETIEDFQKLADLTKSSLILHMNGIYGKKNPTIEVYDSYRE